MSGIKKIITQVWLPSEVAADTLPSGNRTKPLEWKQVQFRFLLLEIRELQKQLPFQINLR